MANVLVLMPEKGAGESKPVLDALEKSGFFPLLPR